MATNIPPHNLGEVIDATIHLIDNPEATPDDLMQFVKGPDFPTGGLILGRAGIIDAYRTGRGSIRMRAVAEIEERPSGGDTHRRHRAAVPGRPEQRPHQDQRAGRHQRARGHRRRQRRVRRRRHPLVITLKRDAPALIVLNNLYKHTPLQTSFAVNTVALVDGVPRTLNLREALLAYVDHQVEVITRRSEYRLRQGRRSGPTSSRACSRRST